MDRRMAGYGWEDGRISEDDRILMVGWHIWIGGWQSIRDGRMMDRKMTGY
jgi:hypothetical protein